MKDAFQDLMSSVRQAGRIRRGTLKAARTTVFKPEDVKAVRASLAASQSEFCDSRSMSQAFGVARLSLLSSFARDEGREDSDIDLLVEFNRPIGLFEFAGLQRRLGEIVGRRVDLTTVPALEPQVRERIVREAVTVVSFTNTAG